MHADRVRAALLPLLAYNCFSLAPIFSTFHAFPACIYDGNVSRGLDDSRNEQRQIIFLLSLLRLRVRSGAESLPKRILISLIFHSCVVQVCRRACEVRASRTDNFSTLFSRNFTISEAASLAM